MSQIIGIFERQGQAVEAIEQLRQEGFGPEQVRVVAKNNDQSWRIDSETEIPAESLENEKGQDWNGQLAPDPDTTVPALPLAAANPLMLGDTMNTGGATSAAGYAPGIYGGTPLLYDTYESNQLLRDLGLSEADAKKYRERIEKGQLLVVVESDPSDEAAVEMALRRGGAMMIH